MAPSRKKQRLQHDRSLLSKMLEDYEAGAGAHLDEREQASVVESIRRRIEDIDARIEAFGRD